MHSALAAQMQCPPDYWEPSTFFSHVARGSDEHVAALMALLAIVSPIGFALQSALWVHFAEADAKLRMKLKRLARNTHMQTLSGASESASFCLPDDPALLLAASVPAVASCDTLRRQPAQKDRIDALSGDLKATDILPNCHNGSAFEVTRGSKLVGITGREQPSETSGRENIATYGSFLTAPFASTCGWDMGTALNSAKVPRQFILEVLMRVVSDAAVGRKAVIDLPRLRQYVLMGKALCAQGTEWTHFFEDIIESCGPDGGLLPQRIAHTSSASPDSPAVIAPAVLSVPPAVGLSNAVAYYPLHAPCVALVANELLFEQAERQFVLAVCSDSIAGLPHSHVHSRQKMLLLCRDLQARQGLGRWGACVPIPPGEVSVKEGDAVGGLVEPSVKRIPWVLTRNDNNSLEALISRVAGRTRIQTQAARRALIVAYVSRRDPDLTAVENLIKFSEDELCRGLSCRSLANNLKFLTLFEAEQHPSQLLHDSMKHHLTELSNEAAWLVSLHQVPAALNAQGALIPARSRSRIQATLNAQMDVALDRIMYSDFAKHSAYRACRCVACSCSRHFLRVLRLSLSLELGLRSSILTGCYFRSGVETETKSACLAQHADGTTTLHLPPDKTWREFSGTINISIALSKRLRLAHLVPGFWLKHMCANVLQPCEILQSRLKRLPDQRWQPTEHIAIFPKTSTLLREHLWTILHVNIRPHDLRSILRAFLGADEVDAGVLSPTAARIRNQEALVGINHTLETEARYYLARCQAGMRLPWSLLLLPTSSWVVHQPWAGSISEVQAPASYASNRPIESADLTIPELQTLYEAGTIAGSKLELAASRRGQTCMDNIAVYLRRQPKLLARNKKLALASNISPEILATAMQILTKPENTSATWWILAGCPPLRHWPNQPTVFLHESHMCGSFYMLTSTGPLEVRLGVDAMRLCGMHGGQLPAVSLELLRKELHCELSEVNIHLAFCHAASFIQCATLLRVLLQHRCGSKLQSVSAELQGLLKVDQP